RGLPLRQLSGVDDEGRTTDDRSGTPGPSSVVCRPSSSWSPLRDSIAQPEASEASALSIELRGRIRDQEPVVSDQNCTRADLTTDHQLLISGALGRTRTRTVPR